jgi:hypothetical protein
MSTSTPLYRKPMTPGYLGTYNWRSTLLGLLLFITTNIITTQHIASHFDYQPALGAPLFQVSSIRIYAPYKWFVWILRFGNSLNPLIRQPLLASTLITAIRVCSNTLRCCPAQHTPKQKAHPKHRRSSWKRPMGERRRNRTVRSDESKARRLHRGVAG